MLILKVVNWERKLLILRVGKLIEKSESLLMLKIGQVEILFFDKHYS
jgi:hypothetical protein